MSNLNPQQFEPHVIEAARDWEGSVSMEMTHAAAKMTGYQGWSASDEHPRINKAAKTLVENAQPTTETLYSGHAVPHREFKVGDHFDVPLMATSRWPEIAEGFSNPGGDEENPHIYEFRGAHGVPVNTHEVVITGKYEVDEAHPGHVVFRRRQPGSVVGQQRWAM